MRARDIIKAMTYPFLALLVIIAMNMFINLMLG
ncbi:hypothetical protein UMC2_37651 [[Clostridium] sordellii]|nr:hypothetical protein UMC2_37651 [[Clostridium] sordellii] [Paeniclostridium sordellii]